MSVDVAALQELLPGEQDELAVVRPNALCCTTPWVDICGPSWVTCFGCTATR